jgi:hypothetical protein
MINSFLSTMSLWDPALIEQLAGQHQLITDTPSDIIEPPENSLIIAIRSPSPGWHSSRGACLSLFQAFQTFADT